MSMPLIFLRATFSVQCCVFALALGASAANAQTGEPCAGVDTSLTEKNRQNYAQWIAEAISADLEPAERFEPSEVDVSSVLSAGNWSAAYASIPVADPGFFFFQNVNGQQELRDVWGGMAEPSDRPELIG